MCVASGWRGSVAGRDSEPCSPSAPRGSDEKHELEPAGPEPPEPGTRREERVACAACRVESLEANSTPSVLSGTSQGDGWKLVERMSPPPAETDRTRERAG